MKETLNITNGDVFNHFLLSKCGGEAVPFREVMMDGETVPVDSNFSNGAYWPGDDNLSPDESCGCNCSVEITVIN